MIGLHQASYRNSTVANTFTDQVPNPSKVLIVLEELNLPFESSWVELDALKQKPYTGVNPNGRVPAIEDPNQGVTLWESGAIVQVSLSRHVGVTDRQEMVSLLFSIVFDRHVRQRPQDFVRHLSREVLDPAMVILPSLWPRSLFWTSCLVSSPLAKNSSSGRTSAYGLRLISVCIFQVQPLS